MNKKDIEIKNVKHALRAIYNHKDKLPYLETKALDNFIDHGDLPTSTQIKNIVLCLGYNDLENIPHLDLKHIAALFVYAGFFVRTDPEKSNMFWLIYYEYFDGKDRLGVNITIRQSPASWLANHRKVYPDEVVMLKMALQITEEEYNNL